LAIRPPHSQGSGFVEEFDVTIRDIAEVNLDLDLELLVDDCAVSPKSPTSLSMPSLLECTQAQKDTIAFTGPFSNGEWYGG
jgi:hypothetical protein